MLYHEVFAKFAEAEIRYLVVGGIAVNLHGYARMTSDLDLMVDLSTANLQSLVQAAQELGYVPRVPVKATDLASERERGRWKEEKGALVFTFVHPKTPFKQLDIFLENPVPFDEAWSRRTVFDLGHVPVMAASVDDLIAIKKQAGRPRDREDIAHLEAIKRDRA